jgi:hypothetical protein
MCADTLDCGTFEDMVELVSPDPGVRLAVIGLREDVGDPDGSEPSLRDS